MSLLVGVGLFWPCIVRVPRTIVNINLHTFFWQDLDDDAAMADTMSADENDGVADADEVPPLPEIAPPPKPIRPASQSFQV